MLKKCKYCKKEFESKRNRKYCSEGCRKKAYAHYQYSTPESVKKYKERIKEENGFDDTSFNYEYRERTAANRGMTTSEYNAYLEERKARRLGLSVQELRHYTYLSKKNNESLYESIGMNKDEYYKRLKR